MCLHRFRFLVPSLSPLIYFCELFCFALICFAFVFSSLPHPRCSPGQLWPSCHSWCGSRCHFLSILICSFCFYLLYGGSCPLLYFFIFFFCPLVLLSVVMPVICVTWGTSASAIDSLPYCIVVIFWAGDLRNVPWKLLGGGKLARALGEATCRTTSGVCRTTSSSPYI